MANKYTEEMVAELETFMSKYDGSIPYADVTEFTTNFDTKFDVEFKQRSIAGKLRHMKADLEKKSVAGKVYSDSDEAKIAEMCADLDNLPWQEDIAEALGRGCKSIGGKLVSMNIYGVKKRDKVKNETVKMFTPEDEAIIIDLVNADGDTFIEDIAEALGKEVSKVRGKLAGMRVKGVLTRNKVAKKGKVYTDELLAEIKGMLDVQATLQEIAAKFSLNEKGLHSILAKKGLIAKSVKGKFWTDERKADLVSMIEDGLSRETIAENMDTTVAVVGKQAKAMSLDFVAAA